jgi:hypothetical protein
MFVDIHEKEDNIIRNVYSKKPVLEFDYCIGLLDTIYGHRISLFKMIAELDHVYDTIRYMINKELSKIKGSALQYDLALLPKTKSLSKVIHEIAEDGIITFNSSAEGNEANVDATSTGGTGVRQVNIGSGEVLLSLMQSAMDVERTMERITGINQARQGLEKASTTATTSQNNVQASRSMTYDLFKFMDDYTKMVMEKVIEKTKINQEELVDGNYDMILSDEQISYLKNSKDLLFENFGVYMADGRKNQMIMERMDILFQQEINGGYITSWDIFNFWRSDTVADAAKVIEKAKDRMMQARQQDQQSQQQMQQQNLEAQRQMMLEDREDKQAHEIEIEKMKAMIKTGQDMAKIAVDENNLKQQMSHEQSLERMRQRGM